LLARPTGAASNPRKTVKPGGYLVQREGVIEPSPEALFRRYRETGDPRALAAVFDRYAAHLLLVAAHLAGGHVAEDLMQETFLDAIQHRERWDATRPLAPWLVGILGNHVRLSRRQRRRVPDPQRIEWRESERPEDVAAANECAAAVHTAVERLPRHYRQVLFLRLVHGLELQQIAQSLDVPLGTVKVRLHRGVALLRRALPAGFASTLAVLLTPGNGLAAVRQVVIGHAGAVAGTAAMAAGLVFGGWVMKQVVLGVLVVALIVGAWFGLDAATSDAAPVGPDSAANPVAAALDSSGRAGRDEAVTPSPAAIAGPDTVREAAPTTGAVAVRVTWGSDGAPARDIEVVAYRRGQQERTASGRARLLPLGKRVSNADGRLQFDDLAPGSWCFRASKYPSVAAPDTTVEPGVVNEGSLALEGDLRLRVSVLDDARQPQSGAEVWCQDQDANGDVGRCLGRTNGAGELLFRGLPLGRLWARHAGRQPSPRHELPWWDVWDVPREEVAVTLVLGAPGCSLLGTVVDPSGRPVPEARVFVACDDAITASKEQRLELFMTTDLTGRFVCDEVPAGERSIVADAPGFAAAMARITTTPTETATTTLALRVGATLSGRVTDDGGRPLAGVNVAAGLRTIMLGFSSSWRWERSAATDADGRYRLDAIAPGSVQARVAVEPEVLRSFELVEGEQVTWDVTKEPERCIAGIVLGPEDRPMKGWQIRLRGHTARGDFRSHEAMADTDAAGRFRLAGLADIDYRVFVFAPLAGKGGSRAAAMVPRAVLAAVRPSPTELTVRLDAAALASGWIEGSIAMPEGLAAKAELSLYAQILRGGAFSLPTERLEAGVTTFRIGPLPAGDYDLLCDIEGRTRLAQKGLHLAPGATLRLPPFAADAQHPLQLVLRHADGRPATGGDVKLRDGLARCRETAPGHYESLPVAPGR
jgi:RNA polymerase sigma-70 factor (ECF subfamily)